MIRPPAQFGAAFTDGSDGDVRSDPQARLQLTIDHAIPERWATLRQVHGDHVVRVSEPGHAGAADALWTTEHDLAVAVFTADCFGVVLKSEYAVGVAHAGWRGASSGVVARLRSAMAEEGHDPEVAAVGPGIGPCCFEVGQEVVDRFRGLEKTTSWNTPSVDLRAAVAAQLEGVETWVSDVCTQHQDGFFSHRQDGTSERMAALGWLS